MSYLESLMREALRLARDFLDNAGMASVCLRYNPHLAEWEAESSWSDDTRIVGFASESMVDAVLSLIDILKAEEHHGKAY